MPTFVGRVLSANRVMRQNVIRSEDITQDVLAPFWNFPDHELLEPGTSVNFDFQAVPYQGNKSKSGPLPTEQRYYELVVTTLEV